MSWENFNICKCLKIILKENGFDNCLSLRQLNVETLHTLEDYIEKNRNFLEKLPSCHDTMYKNQTPFSFLPGHRISLLHLPEYLTESDTRSDTFSIDNPAFSRILKELVMSSLNNANKPQTARRFSKVLLDFSMYIYMASGRASYEILSANLPMPKVSTIRKIYYI